MWISTYIHVTPQVSRDSRQQNLEQKPQLCVSCNKQFMNHWKNLYGDFHLSKPFFCPQIPNFPIKSLDNSSILSQPDDPQVYMLKICVDLQRINKTKRNSVKLSKIIHCC